MIDRQELDNALRVIPNTDREIWYRVGAALKTGLGEEGRDIFLKWSESPDYKESHAKNTWKSLQAGRIDIGYVFNRAKEWGYSPSKTFTPPSKQEIEAQRQAAEAARQQALEVRQAEMAKAKAEAQTRYSALEPIRKLDHEYLVNKGIDDRSLTRQVRRQDDKLVIPMKISGEIVGLQEINKTGRKSFTKGMELKGASMVLGSWANRDKGIVLTEGYATAASIHKATGLTTIVCFAGFNLKEIADRLPKDFDSPIFIAADNDLPNKHTGKRPGLEFANAAKGVLGDKASVIEPNFSDADFKEFEKLYGSRPSDFNDLHKLHGLEAVVKQFNEINSERNMDTNKDNTSAEDLRAAELEKALNNLDEIQQRQADTYLDGVEGRFTDSDYENEQTLDNLDEYQQRQTDTYLDKESDAAEVKEFKKNQENSIAPAIDKIIEKRTALMDQLKDSTTIDKELLIEKKEPLKNPTEAQAQELPESTAKPSVSEKKAESIDIDKELSTPIVLDHDYDHPPGQLKVKYLFTQKGDYINKQGDVFFMDKGSELRSPKEDRETINDMLEVAREKGWSSINLTGTKEFRQIAYIEAASRGIDAHGYKPTEKDLAMVQQLLEERSVNTINQADPALASKDTQTTDTKLQTPSAQDKKEKAFPLKGELLDHGKAKYQFDDKKSMSYFVSLRDSDGNTKVHWGKELESAIDSANVKTGDKIELLNHGRQAVQVEQKVFDKDGNFSHTETIEAHRNQWEIRTEKELTKEADSGLTAAQENAEKDKLVNQNRAPSEANIEASARVDENGADIPMAGVAGQEIQDELRAFMNGLTTKQSGLNKSSLAALKVAKEAVKGVVSGLTKEQQNLAIKNFNEKIDERIDGKTLAFKPEAEQERPTPPPVAQRDREPEQELER